jgi:multisubunit Na+/H+ antiporter MnhB subunit
MARARYFAPHTAAFAAGCVATALAVALAQWLGGAFPAPSPGAAAATLGTLVMFAFFEGALFALGCAMGGVERLPRPGWAFAAGIVVAAGFVLMRFAMGELPDKGLARHEHMGVTAAVGTTYAFIAPMLAGFVCALRWQLALRRAGRGEPKGPE